MSQDYTVDCFAAGNEAQSDLANMEKNFECLRTGFSGASAPANPVTGMHWLDTTNHILKVRNEANNAWLNLLNMTTGSTVTVGAGLAGGGESSGVITISVDTSGISQSLLKTSQGSISKSTVSLEHITLPGGEYGFFPQCRTSASSGVNMNGWLVNAYNSTSYATVVAISLGGTGTAYVQQRYVTSSGEVFWIYVLRDKETKKVLSCYQAPDHPCFGNGGKPLVVAHPFNDFDPSTQEIIVINPDHDEVKRMVGLCTVPGSDKPDRDIIDVLMDEYMIMEKSSPVWPETPVTVGLPNNHDWKRMQDGTRITPIKMVIPKADMLIAKSIERRN